MSSDPPQSAVVTFVVASHDEGERLDKLVVIASAGRVGRAGAKQLFAAGRVRVDGHRVSKGRAARAGESVEVMLSPIEDASAHPEPEESLVVRLEREDLVVVVKRPGQPTAPLTGGERGTLVNALLARYPEMQGVGYGPLEPGIIHRLDTDTSGLMVAARSLVAFEVLAKGLREGLLHKEYLLICEQEGLSDTGEIALPLASHPGDKRKVAAFAHPRDAERHRARPTSTQYRVLERSQRWALVLATAPRALRHQLRVHFAAVGHPLAGDVLYGGDGASIARHALHAHAIAWGGDEHVAPFDVREDLPDDMRALVG